MQDVSQHPIFGIIIAIFIIVLVITESILKEKVLKNRLTFSFLNLSVFVVCLFLYETYILVNENYLLYYIIYTYLNYAVFLLTLYQTFRLALVNGSQYQLIIKGIKNSKWNVYFVIDQRERIKDMSSSLLRELNLDKDDVIGKKMFSVFQSKIRFTKMNNEDANDRTVEKFFIEYKKEVSSNDHRELELQFNNFRGDAVILHLNIQPIFVLGRYKGFMVVGEKRSEEELMAIEKELKTTDNELESIRHKFIATLELTDEGLFYIDLDQKEIWVNDVLLEALHLPSQTMNLSDFRELMDKDDLKKYLQTISGLTQTKDTYKTSYRLLVDGQYIWVKEKGKRLFEDKSSSVIMGLISPMQQRHFRKTNIDVLDNIKDENYLIPDIQTLIKSKRPFQLAIFSLKNIPQINEEHGRSVGNMVMAQYVAKMKESFISESSDIYRLSGLDFAFTITDQRKMSILHSGIKSNEDYLNMNLQYGSLSVDLEVKIGIAQMYDDAINAEDLYQNAMLALKTANHPKYKGQGCYFKDIK